MKHLILLIATLGFFTATSSFGALWTSGHGDLGITYDDSTSQWEIEYHFHEEEEGHDEGEGEEEHGHAVIDGAEPTQEHYELGDLSVRVVGPALPAAFPTDSGAANIYTLPQAEATAEALNNPFMGINAELEGGAGVPTGVFVNDEFTLSLVSVSGPGSGVFSVWSTGATPAENALLMSSAASTGNDLVFGAQGHSHYNMGFSEEGVYDVTFQVSGTLLDSSSTSDTFTMNFTVVPEPSALSLALLGVLGLLRRKRA